MHEWPADPPDPSGAPLFLTLVGSVFACVWSMMVIIGTYRSIKQHRHWQRLRAARVRARMSAKGGVERGGERGVHERITELGELRGHDVAPVEDRLGELAADGDLHREARHRHD